MTIDWKARAEAAEARANSFYRTFLETIRAFGGVAEDGLSDAFIQLGVPAEAAAVVKRMKAAEAERDDLQRHFDAVAVATFGENAEADRDALARQNAALRAALAMAPSADDYRLMAISLSASVLSDDMQQHIAKYERLRESALALTPPATLAAARKDAARWQFVRANAEGFRITVSGKRNPRYAVHTRLTSHEYDTYDNIDAAIDAAMGGE